MITKIASIVLVVAAFVDGLSTARFLRKGLAEQNILFGEHPSTARVFGEGAIIIGLEIVAALLLFRWSRAVGTLATLALLGQAGYHIRCALLNFKL